MAWHWWSVPHACTECAPTAVHGRWHSAQAVVQGRNAASSRRKCTAKLLFSSAASGDSLKEDTDAFSHATAVALRRLSRAVTRPDKTEFRNLYSQRTRYAYPETVFWTADGKPGDAEHNHANKHRQSSSYFGTLSCKCTSLGGQVHQVFHSILY